VWVADPKEAIERAKYGPPRLRWISRDGRAFVGVGKQVWGEGDADGDK
jgi:hypothetical protein